MQTRPGFLPSLALTEVSPPDRFPQVFYRHNAVDTLLAITDEALDYVALRRMFITNGTSLCASPSRESTYRALERAHQAGARVVLDVDYRAMSWSSPDEAGLAARLALPFVDVLIGNEPELMLVAGETTSSGPRISSAMPACPFSSRSSAIRACGSGRARNPLFCRLIVSRCAAPLAPEMVLLRASSSPCSRGSRCRNVCITATRRPRLSSAG